MANQKDLISGIRGYNTPPESFWDTFRSPGYDDGYHYVYVGGIPPVLAWDNLKSVLINDPTRYYNTARQMGKTRMVKTYVEYHQLVHIVTNIIGRRNIYAQPNSWFKIFQCSPIVITIFNLYNVNDEIYPMDVHERNISFDVHYKKWHRNPSGTHHGWVTYTLDIQYVDGMELKRLRRHDIPDSYHVNLNLISKYRKWLPREPNAIDLVYVTKGDKVTERTVSIIDESPFIPHPFMSPQKRKEFIDKMYAENVRANLKSLGISESDCELRMQSLPTEGNPILSQIKPRMSGDQVLSYDWCSDKK